MTSRSVVIVEDQRRVADVHGRLVASVPGLEPVGVAAGEAQARELIAQQRPDLVLLDLGLRDGDGLGLLRALRAVDAPVEVIVVTASRDAATVRACVHLGVVDYLVKPFAPERLLQALALFRHRMGALGDAELGQPEIDRLCASGRRTGRTLPRDLSTETLRGVRDALQAGPASAREIGETVGVARVTARRYLEYLVANGELDARRRVADGPGRPEKTYARADSATRT